MSDVSNFEFLPLTPERWNDFEALFGPTGAHNGCWCMWWRLNQTQFTKQTGDENKIAMKSIVDQNEPPGILAYVDGKAVAWCSLGPRDSFPALNHSPRLKKVDNKEVWSIVCFYVEKDYRGQGLHQQLIEASVDHAVRNGATVIEAYPVQPRGKLIGYSGFTGLAPVFRRAGFVEVLRRTPNQPIMRFRISEAKAAQLQKEVVK